MAQVRFPGESEAYRTARDQLLEEEAALRQQIEKVAALRRQLPLGGVVASYSFAASDGAVTLDELFGDHASLLVYSYMYAGDDQAPCPMCSAFMDSLQGQIKHLQQRMSVVVTARAPLAKLTRLQQERGWGDITFVSSAENDYPRDYHSEMPDGSQIPMANVFVRRQDRVHHFWNSELFFVPWSQHPRHVDMLWPLWHFFDLTPEGREEFGPRLQYD